MMADRFRTACGYGSRSPQRRVKEGGQNGRKKGKKVLATRPRQGQLSMGRFQHVRARNYGHVGNKGVIVLFLKANKLKCHTNMILCYDQNFVCSLSVFLLSQTDKRYPLRRKRKTRHVNKHTNYFFPFADNSTPCLPAAQSIIGLFFCETSNIVPYSARGRDNFACMTMIRDPTSWSPANVARINRTQPQST